MRGKLIRLPELQRAVSNRQSRRGTRDSQWRSYLPWPTSGPHEETCTQIPLATHRRTNPPPAKTKTDSQQSSELASAVQLLTIVGAVRFVNVHCVVSEARQRNASEEDCHYRHVHCEAARIGGRDQVLDDVMSGRAAPPFRSDRASFPVCARSARPTADHNKETGRARQRRSPAPCRQHRQSCRGPQIDSPACTQSRWPGTHQPNAGNYNPAGCGRVPENIKRTIIQAARTNWNLELFALPSSRGRAKWVAGVFAGNNSPMPKKISLRDARGKLISGSFAVREGMITVTASDGRTKTAKIDEGMLRHETLAKMLLLQMHREGVIQGPTM